MKTGAWLMLSIAACAGCAAIDQTRQPLPTTAPADIAKAPVARVPLQPPPIPPIALAPTRPPMPQSALPPIVVPPKTLYVCVNDANGERKQTAIEFSSKAENVCRRHPEMGPCQYERNLCRSSGGRVFAANGVEITLQTEAGYDKKVMRVRFGGD